MARWTKTASAGSVTASGPQAPGDVTITGAIVSYSAPDAAGKRQIIPEITFTAPTPLGTFLGVHAYAETPALTGNEERAGSAVAGSAVAGNDEGRIDLGKYTYIAAQKLDDGSYKVRLSALCEPEVEQTWRVSLTSFSDQVDNKLSPATGASPSPNITFQAKPYSGLANGVEWAPNPTSPVVDVVYEWRESKWYYQVRSSWTDPTYNEFKDRYAQFAGVEVTIYGPTGDPEKHRVAKGNLQWISDWKPVPEQAEQFSICFPAYDVQGRANGINDWITPALGFTVTPQAPSIAVTGQTAKANFSKNVDGGETYNFSGSFTEPSDPTYRGCIPIARYPLGDGTYFESRLPDCGKGTTTFETPFWTIHEERTWEVRFVSYDANNNETDVNTAPVVSGILVKAQTAGGLSGPRITGEIPGASITHVAIDSFSGTLPISKINNLETFSIGSFSGTLPISKISNLGTFNISDFTGTIGIDKINNLGTFSIGNFAGQIGIDKISNLSSFSIGNFAGNLDVGKVANLGTFSIGSFAGVITTAQIQDGFLADLKKFADDLRPITRVATLPALPSAAYPVNTIVLNQADSKLYKNAAGTWTTVAASDTITGKISSGDILSVNAGTINGQINAGVITHVAVSQFAGTLSTTQCSSISISSFNGNLDVSRLTNLSTLAISSFSGNLDASRVANITAINIGSFAGNLDVSRVANLGTLSINTFSGSISSLNAGTVTLTGQWGDSAISGLKASKLIADTIAVNIVMTSPDIRSYDASWGNVRIYQGILDVYNTSGTDHFKALGGYAIASRASGPTANMDPTGFSILDSYGFPAGSLTAASGFKMMFQNYLKAQIDASGNALFADLKWTGYLKGPWSADTYLAWNPKGKIAFYDASGNFVGWIPVMN